ncbi:magnesium and cobalt efflux protein CorB [Luminiphilus syltensis NOR5-1B]|uniref:Magnesium and cobalt efflux protein CorB n=1 Tax=Luminiphilus syltensis NOR5-1B TaxID=565045 RepID=B8KXC7_9GAMM|nr:HlyC/CorC family transporter [Luminiphilus syltensis]EED36620.1 magnesium and cobalt efflux protein CorB [Luminiphilus syltensis NOR5-1B]
MNDTPIGLLFAALAVLILMSGFFSSSETSMMALNRYRLKHLRGQGHRGARRASKLLDRPDRLIGLILIGNNLVNIMASAIATVIAIRLYGDAGIAIATVLLTIVILIFAEITPKTIAALHPERVAFPFSLVLLPLLQLFLPLVAAINSITNGILRLMGFKPDATDSEALSQEELRTIVTESGSMIPRRHQRMLVNILDLEEVTVDDIMVPRNEVFGIDLNDDDATILDQLQHSTHTLVPVWNEDINDIKGVLHLRKLSRVLDGDGLNRDALMVEIQAPYFIPENTPLHTQLLQFQQKKLRLGIVVDEYGDVMGLATLEDILEEIVGEFTSNLIEEQEEVIALKGGGTVCTGTISIRELNRQQEWDLPTDGPKTLSGLALEALETFPCGPVAVQIPGYVIEVVAIDGNLISRLRITPNDEDIRSVRPTAA